MFEPSQHQFSPNKLFYHSDKLEHIIDGEIVFPSVYEISLVGSCNHKCRYCVSKSTQNVYILSKEQIISVICQIAQLGGQAITLTGGGEPLLHPFIDKAIKIARAQDLSVGLITNGSRRISTSLAAVFAKNLSFCRISIDSINEAVYASLRGRNDLYDVLENVKALVGAKARTRSRMLLGVHIVWVDQTCDDIQETIRYFALSGIDFVQVRPVDNIPNNPRFSVPQYNEMQREFLERQKKDYCGDGFRVLTSEDKWREIFHSSIGKRYTGCSGANFTAAVGHDYRVYFCCTHIGSDLFLLGDLETTTLRDILLGTVRTSLIADVDHSLCQNQCRNHLNNKTIAELIEMNRSDLNRLILEIRNQPPPLHWEFL